MATLLTIKRRIKTAGNVSKTTKALQMISASKLKKAQQASQSSQPYVDKLDLLSKALTQKVEKDNQHAYMKTPQNVKAKLLIIISPDKGLAGGLVANLLREVVHFQSEGKTFFITIGKKAEGAVASLGKDIVASFPFGTTLPPFDAVYPIAKLVNEYFLENKVAEVKILYTRFNNVFTQTAGFRNLLPVSLDNDTNQNSNNSLLFEPNLEDLLPDLLQHYLEMVIYQSLLDAYASEQASRMVAMKNATDNAMDIIADLKLEYNKTRQEKITNELLDIGGAQIKHE